MQDDRQKNEDDDFENDLDMDDEPDDDDLDAEWEALDADEDEDAGEPSAGAEQKPAGKKQARTGKTFLQKNFSLVVGGIVIAGGVLFLLPALLRQPIPAAPKADALPADLASNTAEIEDLQSGLPPMPTPIDGQPENAPPAPAEGEDLAALEAAQAPLLPMPEPTEGGAPAAEVSALDPAPPGETAMVEGGLVEAAPALSTEPMPVPSEEAPAVDPVAATDASSSLSEVESVSEDTLLDEPSVAPIADAPAAISPSLPEAAADASGVPAVSPAPPAVAPEDTALRQAADEAAAKAKDAEKALKAAEDKARSAEEKAAKLAESVKSNEKTIAELEKAIEALKKDAAEAKSSADAPSGEILKKLDTAKPAAEKTETAKKEEKKAEPSSSASSSLVISPVVSGAASKPKTDSAAEAPKVRKEEPVSRSATAAASPAREDWVLRSAQPGRAVIAKASTDDLQNIAVGDTVKGLGRITSIQMEGGRWVVRGTKGEVAR